MKADYSLSVGTISGTLVSAVPNISSGDVLRTVILAAVGAAVSFLVSYFLKWCFKRGGER